ncbi:hypothetical protein BGZ94_000464, partial [Podila epigama]
PTSTTAAPTAVTSIHTAIETCPRDLEVIEDVDEEYEEDSNANNSPARHSSTVTSTTTAAPTSTTTSNSQPIPTSRRFSRRLSYHQHQYHSSSGSSTTCPSTPSLSSSPPVGGGMFPFSSSSYSPSSSVTSSPGGGSSGCNSGGSYSLPMSPSLTGFQCHTCGGPGMSPTSQWTSDIRQYIITDIGPQPSNSQVPTLRSQSHLVRQRSSSKVSPAAVTSTMPYQSLSSSSSSSMLSSPCSPSVPSCPECGESAQNTADGVVPSFGIGGLGHGSLYSRYSSVTDLCTILQDEILPPMKAPFERRRFVGHDEWDDDE